eukprot:scaffold44056_cov204-Skeletonema_marinoi.AAC.1
MDIASRGKSAAATRKRKPSADNDDDRAPKKVARKQYRYECSAEGCTKAAQQGGLCLKHGAKVKRCSYEGCTNQDVVTAFSRALPFPSCSPFRPSLFLFKYCRLLAITIVTVPSNR